MPLPSSVVPLPTRGAARVQDLLWPNRQNRLVGAIAATLVGRISGKNGAGIGTAATSLYGDGGTAWALWHGRAVAQCYCNTPAPPNGGMVIFQEMTALPAIEIYSGNLSTVDDYACTRITFILAFPPKPATLLAGDFGPQVVAGLNPTGILDNAASGFGFQLTADDEVSLIVRGPLGLVSTALTSAAGGFNHELYHAYDFIIQGATHLEDATLTTLIDGEVKIVLPWGAGTMLPSPLQGGVIGFVASIRWTTGSGYFVEQVRFAQAPTVSSLP